MAGEWIASQGVAGAAAHMRVNMSKAPGAPWRKRGAAGRRGSL
jgi:hypothetical protein